MSHLGEVQSRLAELEANEAKVLAVSFAPPAMASEYAADHALPFPIASDVDRGAYRAFGLARGDRTTVFRPRAIAQHLGLRLRGFSPGRHQQEDVYQLGGDFVVDREGRIVLAHPSVAGDDRAPVTELLDALRTLRRRRPA